MLTTFEVRYTHIDSMRAIAALCVAILHICQKLVSASGSGRWLLQFADDWQLGAFGVSLFFLVSGFVIPASFGNRESRAEGLRIFAIRRVFRLYPAYWLSIPLVLFSIWWLQGRAIDAGVVAINVTMFQRVLGFPDLVNLYWTLSYELVFYMLCAALYATGLLHRAGVLVAVLYGLFVAYAAAALSGLGSDGYAGFLADAPPNLGLMFTGAVLRQWHDGKPLGRWVKIGLVVIVLFYLIPAARSFSLVDGQFVLKPTGGWAGAFAIVFFTLFAMWLRLSHPVLSWLGAISYSVYLFHMAWAYLAAWLIAQAGFEWARGWDLVVYVMLVLGVTVVFSAAVYRWLELPMIELGRRLTQRHRPAYAA